jgi:hypothetical protein
LSSNSEAELEGHAGGKQRAACSRRQLSKQIVDTVEVAKEKERK